MSLKSLVASQHRATVDAAAVHARAIDRPSVGWLRAMRKALGMSGAQLARRLGVTRAVILQAERNELAGTIGLQTLQRTAAAMGCRLVYALVPVEGTADQLIEAQAHHQARALVDHAGEQMALEAQGLSPQQRLSEIERLQRQLLVDLPSDLWDER
jgi:predicted DNA-binding mobile mystery protein A